MPRMVTTCTLHVSRYIASPYWPELEELINIQKSSGMNRARSEARRLEALQTYLKRIDLSMEDYETLQRLAHRPWYQVGLGADETAEIMITSHQLYGCLIESCKRCPAAIRPCDPSNLRSLIRLSDQWLTGKKTHDGIFRRLVMPKDGKGNPLSNQRALRSDPYIADFRISGTLVWYPESLAHQGELLREFISYAGEMVGVGGSRKMDYGRFSVESWQAGVSCTR